MYRAADDIQRKTKQVLEVYYVKSALIEAILGAFVSGVNAAAQGGQTNP
jgi:hypothetical protein